MVEAVKLSQLQQSRHPVQAGLNVLAALSCALVLMLPAVTNRAPFVYFDSAAYLTHAGQAVNLITGRLGWGTDFAVDLAAPADPAAQPNRTVASDDGVLAGRSIYYSFFAWVGSVAPGFGGVVLLQAFTLALLIVLTVRTAFPRAPPAWHRRMALALAAGLAFLTPAGFFVSLVMPDVWAGIMILAFALLMARGRDRNWRARSALGAVLALSVLFHASHVAVLAALLGLTGLALLLPGWRVMLRPGQLVMPALVLAVGVVGHAAFSLMVTASTGKAPIALPFVTAHLVDMGPGTRLARETCPGSGFAICPYADRLPIDWISFLFSRDPETGLFKTVPPSVQRALSQEQARFALATLAFEPLTTSAGLARDGVAQLWHLSVDDVPLTEISAPFLAQNFPPDVAATVRLSTIWSRPWIAPALTAVTQAGTALAALGLMVLAVSGQLPRRGPTATLLLICVAGLVANALICGMLASPYGRFQARVVWLLPLLLAVAVLTVRFPNFVPMKEGST